MTTTKPALNWITIPLWHRANLVGFNGTVGLFRALLDGETMFIGCSTAPASGLGARLDAYRKPKSYDQQYHAWRLIYERREEIEMQIAVLDMPEQKIVRLMNKLIRDVRPRWNVPMERHQA